MSEATRDKSAQPASVHGRASVVGPPNRPEPDRVPEHKPPSGPEPQRVAGPFSGLLVIDLTHVLNGPFGTTILGDLGARVIKIERPGHGDDTRTFGPFFMGQSLYFSFVNRGKESIALNLKAEADRAVFLNMVRQADILTENFRPGAMDRLGCSFGELSKINPRLIYASSTGFGQTGPLRTFPAYDTIVQGMSSLMSLTGFPDGPPTRVGTSVSDLVGGTFMFCGIAAALYAREKTGVGCHVDVSMLDGTFCFLEQGLMHYAATGKPAERIGNRHPYMTPFDTFEASDRQFVICCGNDHLFGELCKAIGRPELTVDARFLTDPDRNKNAAALKIEMEVALKRQPAEHWLKVIHEAGVPVGPILDSAEAAELPQIKARNMWIEAGGVKMPGNPVKLSGYDDPPVRAGAPALNQHGPALRAEFAAVDSAGLTDGFHLMVDALKLNGLDTMYGVAGIPVTDLARLAQAEGIRYVGFRHEQSAGNAAAIAGYLTRKPGVCLTVSAPGFLNGLTALANATTNGFPMIQISGSSDRAKVDLQRGAYEELDQMNAAKPFAKAAYRVDRVEDIGLGVARALRTALSGRPGGVYLDLPGSVLNATLDGRAGARSLIRVVDPEPRQPPAPEAVQRALDLLARAERPLIVLGKGAAYAQVDAGIREFIEKTGIPFQPMSMAKGLLPDDHPQSTMATRSYALANADMVMLVGARLNWLLAHGESPPWSRDARFVQLDIDPTEIDSNRAIDAPVVGDIASSVSALLAALAPGQIKPRASWVEALAQKKRHNVERMAQHLAAKHTPMGFFGALGAIKEVLADKPDVFVVNEGANTLDLARDVLEMRTPRKRIDSGTWGVMGIGMGYAIGASVVSGNPVVATEGDSAFGFSGMEIETICRYHLPIVTVVFNNGGIYRGDGVNLAGGADPSPTTLMRGARYDKLIEAFGGASYYAVDPPGLANALSAALAAGEPALIDCAIDPSIGTESGHIGKLNPRSAVSVGPHV